MNLYAVSALVNVATSTVLGILVLLSDRKAAINRLFAAFAASVTFWSYSYFSWQIATDANSALLWVHLLMAGAILITPIYFHFSMRFLQIHREHRLLIWVGYAFVIIFSIANWIGGLYIQGVKSIAGFSFWPIAGPVFWVFLLVWVFYAILPVIFFVSELRKAVNQGEILAVRYMLAGTIIGYAGGCTNYFLWYAIPILPIGNISASVYLALVAYAIMRYQLFNMKLIATELLVMTLWLFVFARMILATGQDQIVEAALLAVLLVVGVLLIRSVDSEVEQKEKIQKLATELQTINNRQETLIHFIGHEVKGFLTKAEGAFAALIEGDFGTISPETKPFVERALEETRSGVDSVSMILKAANLKKGTVSYDKKPFDLKALVEKAVDTAKPAAEKKGLVLSFSAEEGSYEMNGDKAQINDHVLRNLIDNSINYTPTGSVAVSLRQEGNKIIFAVKDTGIGITDEDKQKLFTEGGHGKDSIKVNAHSTGYGLYIAKQIVEAHGGTISASSDGADKGSMFTVEFPTQ